MSYCNRCLHSIHGNHGYGLALFGAEHSSASPPPQDRSFALAGDTTHYAPDRPVDIQHLKLNVTLDFDQETVSGTAYTTFTVLYEELETVTFDAIELGIEEVTGENGTRLKYGLTDKKLVVTLDRRYSYGEELTIAVTYHARPRTGMHFNKPSLDDPTRPVQAWSYGQPAYHRYWFPCHDSPNDRFTSEIIVTVPSQLLTISNGILVNVTDNGETKTHHWRQDFPQAVYLFSLVAGDFAVIEDSYNGKPVTYYVRQDRKDDARYYMGQTPEMMRFFSEYTGVEYPYEKYAQTVVELYMGAMEHTTATTHSFALLLDQRAALDVDYVPVVAHELAHQWFGDYVTCRDWASGWLNEGFATYFEHLWGEHSRGKDYFKYSMHHLKQGYLTEDSDYRRPIVYHVYYDQGFELFDRHMYSKGGWVLHMLRHQLGEPAFRRAVKTYLERYARKEVVTSDLERTLEEVTGRSLAQFFRQWVYSGGYPAFEVEYTWNSERSLARLKIKQTQKVDDLTPCFVTPVDVAFTIPVSAEAAQNEQTTETKTISLRIMVGEDGQVEQNFFLPLEREPLMIRFDPDGWLLKTLKFPRPAKLLRYQLAHDKDVLGRIEAAELLGQNGDPESFAALTTALHTDPFYGVRAAAATALGTYKSEEAQQVLLAALQHLDPEQFSLARAAVVQSLGHYQAPQQVEFARRSAEALRTLLDKGDISYRVEYAAAQALGRTHLDENTAFLIKLLERPSWMYFVHNGIMDGLGASGDEQVIDVIGRYLLDEHSHPMLRLAAASGLAAVGRHRALYNEEAIQRAATAAATAVEHDYWPWARLRVARALAELGEKRAISALERAISRELDDGALRNERVAVHKLREGGKRDEQMKQLRKDLDEVREENRKLKEQLASLEARLR